MGVTDFVANCPLIRATFALASLWALGACGTGTAEPTPSDDCTAPSKPGEPVAGALQIGTGGPRDFRAFAQGESHELVLGSQGGYMPSPIFRVDAASFGTDGVCAFMHVDLDVDGRERASFDFMVRPTHSDGAWYFGGLPLFLSTDASVLDGRSCRILATFNDDDRDASADVQVILSDIH